jgi:hypothetical protein
MTTTLSNNGLLEIPEVFRKADHLQSSRRCEIERLGERDYRVQVPASEAEPGDSWLQILRECPEKDWWRPLDHSQLLITPEPSRLFDEAAEEPA